MSDDPLMYEEEIDPIEGYCMSCRESVEIEDAKPVWTRKGQPATKGTCPTCGGTVFRMGKTDLHNLDNRPEPISIGDDGDKRTRPKLTRDTVYVNYTSGDEEIAQRLGDDLEKSGLAVWLHEDDGNVNWSSGVHPALAECKHMVYVLSESSLGDNGVSDAWAYFRKSRKPIVIAQVESVDPPDDIRRSPRFDMTDYKTALRQIVRTIGEM